ncbi:MULTISPECIES: acyl-CoA dehydrogenase family protein [unclassified Bradyrhizobium]|uniref:acyl-CoA dehydrogenase family protein n=1 Tax=unclassified Bradyrhizobium TaxID=2631580 RepID=UPI000411554F|nr:MULTISPECIES: acyl-CoA dehydrogenase family protein [unclassified Bradyrhizobium]MCP3460679.1 acyl-CoA dehydrogenase family protein [Bradyrhizobium sp. CCGUVB23]
MSARVGRADRSGPGSEFSVVPKAQIIRSDAEAIDIAHKVAAELALEAPARDRERRQPVAELDRFSSSGLWGISVPKSYGGAGVSFVTVGEVVKIISAADPSLGQIPQSHLRVLDLLRLTGSE